MKYFIGIKFHIYQKYLQWKKTKMMSSVLIMVVLDATTQEKKLGWQT